MNERREVFLGLIAPIGIDLDLVQNSLARGLKTVGYNTHAIRLTEIFTEISHNYDVKYDNEFDRYRKLIVAGDDICRDSQRSDILALYGIQRLSAWGSRTKNDEVPGEVAHIFRQIKRPREIQTLKRTFGRNILFISCYSSKQDRQDYLVKKILRSDRGKNRTELESDALKIISIDEDEKDKPTGQRVLECYAQADYVLDCSDLASLNLSVDRLIAIYFGHPFISPTKDEYCSYFANAASYRSLDLSRQVGAAIFNKECEIISLGCNEVPKAGGGTYWADGDRDRRDYALGQDSNHKVREDMATDVLTKLQGGWLKDEFSKLKPAEIAEQAFDKNNGPLANSMISDVMEYGRMVHAEMNAITDAARSQKSTQGTILYSTTMPCHLCAKLIIAAGISRVVYVQPYSKSLVDELYADSISIDQPGAIDRVIFETLKGVTPNGFKIAFRKSDKRKNSDGSAITWNPLEAKPTFISYFPFYRDLEIASQSDLKQAIDNIKIATLS